MSEQWRMPYAAAADLAALRAFVAARAVALGLPAERAELLVLAVSELATNTLQHTGGGGSVTLSSSRGRIVCDVVDDGTLPDGAGPSFGRPMPAAHAVRGRGLAIVEHVCDEVETVTSAGGIRVRIQLNL